MKTKLLILGTLILFFQNNILAKDTIRLNLNDVNSSIKSIYNIKRNSVFYLEVNYDKNYKLDVKFTSKKINYTIAEWGGIDGGRAIDTKNANKYIQKFQLTSDAMTFTIKLINNNDSFVYAFAVYAKKYMTVMPTGGLALMQFKNQKNYYYVAKEDPIGAPFRGDSSYTFNLMSKQQGWSSNLYLGSNFNYVFNNTTSIGLTTAFGYNIGAKTTPLNALLGGNLTFGNKIKFTFGGGLSFMQIETIADEYLTQSIYSKFSTLPTLPTKINQWSTGYYFSFGVTLATLTDN